jgi:hypothetical protein
LDFRAEARKVAEDREGYLLREGAVHYKAFFEVKKDDIGPENTSFLEIKTGQSIKCLLT